MGLENRHLVEREETWKLRGPPLIFFFFFHNSVCFFFSGCLRDLWPPRICNIKRGGSDNNTTNKLTDNSTLISRRVRGLIIMLHTWHDSRGWILLVIDRKLRTQARLNFVTLRERQSCNFLCYCWSSIETPIEYVSYYARGVAVKAFVQQSRICYYE